ncbi:MAG TPA: hypothetical protein VGM77_00980 [Gemmatimonadales bacterium]|jgi:hypothetical protein
MTGWKPGRRWCALIAMLACVTLPLEAQRPVPLVLNHLDLALDSATWHDVTASPFLVKDFAAVRPAGAGEDLLGRYNWITLRMRQAEPSDSVVLGVERAVDFGPLQTLLRATAEAPATVTGGAGYGMSHATVIAGPRGGVTVLIAMYSDAASNELAVHDFAAPEDRSAHRFLAAFADSTRFLASVSGATLAMPVDQITRVVALAQRDSVRVVLQGEGAILFLSDFTLRLIPPYAGAGIKQLRFVLTREHPANAIYRFGPRSQLRFGPGATAVWDF